MGPIFMVEQVMIELDLALGKITEEQALERMVALTQRVQRHLAFMQLLAAIVPAVVIVGLALLAIRLGTFS